MYTQKKQSLDCPVGAVKLTAPGPFRTNTMRPEGSEGALPETIWSRFRMVFGVLGHLVPSAGLLGVRQHRAVVEVKAAMPRFDGDRYTLTVLEKGRQFIRVKILDTVTGKYVPQLQSSRKCPAMVWVLHNIEVGQSCTCSYLGDLGDAQATKTTVHIPYGNVVEAPLYTALMDQAIREGKDGAATVLKAKKALLALIQDSITKSIKRLHVDLCMRLVVLDTDKVGRNYIGVPVSVARPLLVQVNRTRKGLGLPGLTVLDLDGMLLASVVRFPIGDETSARPMRLKLVADECNCLFIHAGVWLSMDGDCDGDTLMARISKATIRGIISHRHNGRLLKVLSDRLEFDLAVGKDGEPLDIRGFKDVPAKATVEVALELMSKGMVGLVVNLFSRLIVATGCALQTPEARAAFLVENNIQFRDRDVATAKKFRTFFTKIVLVSKSPILQAVFSVRKQKDASAIMQVMSTVVAFAMYGTPLSQAVINRLDGGSTVHVALLNSIVRLLGMSPAEYLKQFPVASMAIGKHVSNAQLLAVIEAINRNSIQEVLEFLDGNALEPEPGVEVSREGGSCEKVLYRKVWGHKFSESEISDWTRTVAGIVNRRYQKVPVPAFEVVRTAGSHIIVRIFGHDARLTNFDLAVEGSKRGMPVVAVWQHDTKRLAPINIHHLNANAEKMMQQGASFEEAMPRQDFVAETILSSILRSIETQVWMFHLDWVKNPEMGKALAQSFESALDLEIQALIQERSFSITPDYEVSILDHEVLIENPKSGFDPLRQQEMMQYLLTCIETGLVHPLTGKKFEINSAVTSKGLPGTVGSIILPMGECGIMVTAHLLGNHDGVNQQRFWREARTVRFALTPKHPNRVMTNGYEFIIPEIIAKAQDALVLVAEVSGLGYLIDGQVVNSDKGYITPRGMQDLACHARAKKEAGLDESGVVSRIRNIAELEQDYDFEEAVRLFIELGYKVIETPSKYLTTVTANGTELRVRQFTIVHPLPEGDPTWMKLYFDGYKGIFVAIEQDFFAEVEPGRYEAVHAIMSGRTFDSKKMYAGMVAGQLALHGHLHFDDSVPLFGEDSLHEELMGIIDQKGLRPDGQVPVYTTQGSGAPMEMVGFGMAGLFRTYVLRQDPEDCSISDRDFPMTLEIVNLVGEDLDALVGNSVKEEISYMALAASQDLE